MESNQLPYVLYSKPGCVQCVATERWLNSRDLRYIKHDVSQDESAYEKVVGLGYSAVPVMVIPFDSPVLPGEHWYGFDPNKLEQLTD